MLLDLAPSLLSSTFLAEPWPGYTLIDSGNGRKLERFQDYLVNRPEPQAMWSPRLPESTWADADATFLGAEEAGNWRFQWEEPLAPWQVSYQGLIFEGRLTAFRHVGYFPEQLPHWRLIEAFLKHAPSQASVLNLFAYTGVASLIAASRGAHVTHVDASEKAIAWARTNQMLSKLEEAPIRWICDDATKFAAREVRREKTYDLILLDPPKFGRGPGKEVWDLFVHLPTLVQHGVSLLAPGGLLILNTYALRLSHLALRELLADCAMRYSQTEKIEIQSGELAIQEEHQGRVIPQSMFALLQKI